MDRVFYQEPLTLRNKNKTPTGYEVGFKEKLIIFQNVAQGLESSLEETRETFT